MKCRFTALAVTVAVVCLAAASRAAFPMPEPGKYNLSTDGELITLSANEVPMKKLMEVINDFTPATIDIDSLPDRNVTLRYENILLDELLMKLNVSFVLTYARASPQDNYELESAWVSHFDAQPVSTSPSASGSSGGAAIDPAHLTGLAQKLGYNNMAEMSNDFGRVYRTPFPVTMSIDGNLNEWPEDIPWHQVDHTMGQGTATNDADASFRFASAADEENLYMAVKISDDEKVLDQSESSDAANEDSMEFQIGDQNVTIKRHQVWRTNAAGELVGSGRQFVSLNNETTAWVVDGEDGWTIEVKVPHSSLGTKPEDAAQIPLELILNDDDDGGDRDGQYRWSLSAGSGGAGSEGTGEYSSSALAIKLIQP